MRIPFSVPVEAYGILELTLKASLVTNTLLVALSVSSGCFPNGIRSLMGQVNDAHVEHEGIRAPASEGLLGAKFSSIHASQQIAQEFAAFLLKAALAGGVDGTLDLHKHRRAAAAQAYRQIGRGRE